MKINIEMRDTNLVTGSNDKLRTALGGYYQIQNPHLDFTGLQRTLQYLSPDLRVVFAHDLDAAEPVIEGTQTAMIEAVVADTDLALTASAESMFPYYTIPISIIGVGPSATPTEPHDMRDDAAILNSDDKWKTYILGGTFSEVSYPGIYVAGTFDVNNFSYEMPYDLLYAKTIDEENHGLYQAIESKSVYNMYLPEYQTFNAANLETDTLNIYDLLYCSTYSQYDAFADVKEKITLGGIYNHDTDSVLDSVENIVPALIKTTSEIVPTSPTDTRKYIDSYQIAREYYYSIASSGSFAGAGIQSTEVLFNKKAIEDLFPTAHDNAESLGAFYPFYNKIGLPAFDAGPLNALIVQVGFSDLLLRTISDGFVSDAYTVSNNNFVEAVKINSLNSEGELYEELAVNNKSLRYIDFKNVLARMVNGDFPRNTRVCRFIGGANYENRAATEPAGSLAHLNKKNAQSMLAGVQRGLLSTEPTGEFESEITPDNYMPWANMNNFGINNFLSISDGELNNRAECVALRINKKSVTSNEEFNFIIQNQPPNASPEGHFSADSIQSKEWSYYDTQVKYGETYQYTTYAYYVVVGYQYKYSDLALSRRISEYGQYIGSELHSDPEDENSFTCIEFYNPATGEAVPSPMKTSESSNLEPLRLNLLNDSTYATAAQELAANTNINYADFNISIEPTIKIFEVATSTSNLTVLDNPPPKADVQPYQVKDQSQRIGFFIKMENPPVREDRARSSTYPTPTNDIENVNFARYLTSQNMLITDKLKFGTVSRPAILEIYRLNAKPRSMSDFSGNMVGTKSLLISDKNNESSRTYITTTCFHEEKIATGHKFYYAFRFLNENNVPSPWSQIIEAELIDDGGYKYANFSNIMESELSAGTQYDNPNTQFKKLLMMRPAIPQIDFNSEQLDYSEDSIDQFDGAKLATELSDNLWNKKYKIRLTSRKTGKKIDLNVNYKLVEG